MTATRRRKKPGTAPKVDASGENTEAKVEASGAEATRARDATSRFMGRPGTTTNDPPNLPIAWGNVVTDTMRIDDPAKLTERLRQELLLGDGRTDYGRVLNALDRSAKNLDDAGRLYRAAKAAEEKYEIEANERLEVLRTGARDELMQEYKAKQRPSPTLKDIEDRIVSNWPDEFKTIKGRLSEMHGTTRSLETLQAAWSSRCADLRIMADKARPI